MNNKPTATSKRFTKVRNKRTELNIHLNHNNKATMITLTAIVFRKLTSFKRTVFGISSYFMNSSCYLIKDSYISLR